MKIDEYYALVREINKLTCYKTIMDITYNYYKYYSPSLLELTAIFDKFQKIVGADGVDKVVADINKVFIEYKTKLQDTIIPIITRIKNQQISEFVERCIIEISDQFDQYDNNQTRSGIVIIDQIAILHTVSRFNFTDEDAKQVMDIYENILKDIGDIAKLRFESA